jgi:molecular chaperone GrpE
MEREMKDQEREHGGERIKSAREILEERLAGMSGKDDAAADALRKAAERAPDAAAAGTPVEKQAQAPDASAKELEALKKKAEERDQLHDQLLRTRADYDNYQKRTKREAAEYRDFALSGIMNDVLMAIDTLDLALHSAGDSKEVAPLKTGVDLVRGQLEKILTDRGATRIATEGAFDPRQHEAVLTESHAELAPGQITRELRRGYMFKDRNIRPAQVAVSRTPE